MDKHTDPDRTTSSRAVLGRKLKNVRERRGLTLRQVAAAAGISESMVSQIEHDRVSPSVDTLLALADTLEVNLDYLFQDIRSGPRVAIVRKAERASRELRGVRYEQLTAMTDPTERHAIEAVIVEIPPGRERGNREHGHPGNELGVVLQGQGILEHGRETYELGEGDSVSFASRTPHTLRNTGAGVLRTLWVNTPPRMGFEEEI